MLISPHIDILADELVSCESAFSLLDWTSAIGQWQNFACPCRAARNEQNVRQTIPIWTEARRLVSLNREAYPSVWSDWDLLHAVRSNAMSHVAAQLLGHAVTLTRPLPARCMRVRA